MQQHYQVKLLWICQTSPFFIIGCENRANDLKCEYKAAKGDCESNSGWMLRNCKWSCKACEQYSPGNSCTVLDMYELFTKLYIFSLLALYFHNDGFVQYIFVVMPSYFKLSIFSSKT